MKIFGTNKIFDIDLDSKVEQKLVVEDDIPEVQVPMPASKNVTQIPRVVSPVQGYTVTKNLGRGQFVCSEYDLTEIGRVEDTESFVRQAFNKKVALMFKEGYDLIGRNPKHVKYIKIRLAQMVRASGEPTLKLLRDVGSSLIRKSNAFLIKVRKEEASGGKLRTEPGTNRELKPVAAYFVAPAETMEASFSNNRLVKWRQNMPDGSIKEYSPSDVIHFFYDRKDGFVFGTPLITPVLDDIRALRKIEENIELLVYQHLFPLFQFKVGTPEMPASIDENGEREIDVIRREIQYMPSEGGIVTTERHEITAIGAEGRALDAKGYLEHFKKRVIAGLGISAVDLGDGDTTNRATSDNMSRNLIDSVKDYQQVLEFFFNELVIVELLLESTFGEDVLDEDNRVSLKFKEIDIDAQIKKEAHMADQFDKNLVSQDEARLRVGYEPMRIPTSEDMESMEPTELQTQFPEWHRTHFKLIQEPLELIKAAGSADATGASMAAGKSPATAIQPGDVDEANQKKVDQELELEKEKSKAKVESAKALAKLRPKPKAKDSFVSSRYEEVQQGVVQYIQSKGKLDHDWVAQVIRASMAQTIDYLVANQATAFRQGYTLHGSTISDAYLGSIASARIVFQDRAERYINKLTRDTISSLKRNVSKDTIDTNELTNLARAVFDTLKYRADFIEYVELNKAKSLGTALAVRNSGQRFLVVKGTSGGCDHCKNSTQIDSFHMVMDDVPPFHAGCECKIELVENSATMKDFIGFAKNPAADAEIAKMKEEGKAADCPKCGKLALLAKDTPDIFNCRACRNSFRKE